MPWPYNEVAKMPNLNSQEWLNTIDNSHPDYGYPYYNQHDTYQTFSGPPNRPWFVEKYGLRGSAARKGMMANVRELTALLPDAFPITADSFSRPGITVKIVGSAAPSQDMLMAMQDPAKKPFDFAVSFLPQLPAPFPGKSYQIPYKSIEWQDFTPGSQSLPNAMDFVQAEIEKIIRTQPVGYEPRILFHCAWGLGRTGTTLAAYKLISNYMQHKDDPECAAYLTDFAARKKTSPVIVHGDDPSEPSQIIYTTPTVALAINEIRRSTNPPIVCVEREGQLRNLELLEDRVVAELQAYQASQKPGYRRKSP